MKYLDYFQVPIVVAPFEAMYILNHYKLEYLIFVLDQDKSAPFVCSHILHYNTLKYLLHFLTLNEFLSFVVQYILYHNK